MDRQGGGDDDDDDGGTSESSNEERKECERKQDPPARNNGEDDDNNSNMPAATGKGDNLRRYSDPSNKEQKEAPIMTTTPNFEDQCRNVVPQQPQPKPQPQPQQATAPARRQTIPSVTGIPVGSDAERGSAQYLVPMVADVLHTVRDGTINCNDPGIVPAPPIDAKNTCGPWNAQGTVGIDENNSGNNDNRNNIPGDVSHGDQQQQQPDDKSRFKRYRHRLLVRAVATVAIVVILAVVAVVLVALVVDTGGGGGTVPPTNDDGPDLQFPIAETPSPSVISRTHLPTVDDNEKGTAPSTSAASSSSSSLSALSNHIVTWGKISTCDDRDFFSAPENNMILSCGGVIKLLDQEQASCHFLSLSETANITDATTVSCQLIVPDDAAKTTDDGLFYQEVIATVVFSCIGEGNADRSATPKMPKMAVRNCTAEPRLEQHRRTLAAAATAPKPLVQMSAEARSKRDRALQEAVSKGGATAFISLGRFCKYEGNWRLWTELYICERGQALRITPLGNIWNANDPSLDDLEEGGGGDLFNGTRRKLQLTEDFGGISWILAELEMFCYQVESCEAKCKRMPDSDACSTACDFDIPKIRINNFDNRRTCFSSQEDAPTLEEMKDMASIRIILDHFIDLILDQL